MRENINVPMRIIKLGYTDEYVELKRAEKVYEDSLWKLCKTQEKLVGDTLKRLDNLRHTFVKYTYDYKKFKERKEWMESLTVQVMVNEIVELQGAIQELMAKLVDISEKLKDMNEKCGVA